MLTAVDLHQMSPRRLTDTEKQDLLARYRAGEATPQLAEAFGCSANTVSRTVKSLLPADEYSALKRSRIKGVKPAAADVDEASQSLEEATPSREPISAHPADVGADVVSSSSNDPDQGEEEETSTLALDDADDFGDDSEEDSDDESGPVGEAAIFTELVPLTEGVDLRDNRFAEPLPLTPGLLPDSVYLLVDKVVELDARPLREFPELGPMDDAELERQGLCLYTSPRTAKRQCGRSQRVIKVPDTTVFERTSSYLLAKGITRLVMEGTLISIDANG